MSYVGVVQENSSVALSFSSLGTIDRILVSEGDHVKKGQVVSRLNTTSAKNIYDAAESALKQAQDGYDRLKSIHDNGSLPEIQMVDIDTKLHQAQSTFNLAKKGLEDCILYSPVTGVVGKKMAEAGEYAIIGKPIMTIMEIGSVRISFSVPENEISGITSGCRSEITVSALGDKIFTGTKVEKNVIANIISHTYPVFVTLPNPQGDLLPGMVCKVSIASRNSTKSIVIPIEVVMSSPDGQKFVWCNDSGNARKKVIVTGKAKGNGIEIKSGLSSGDQIITEGYQKISDGDKIEVR